MNRVLDKAGIDTDYTTETYAYSFAKAFRERTESTRLPKEALIEEAASIEQERIAGFKSNPAIRKAIELYAMKRAEEELKSDGYGDFNNTSGTKSYDYTCKRGSKLYYIEVKGTQTEGDAVIVTKNEVQHAHKNPDASIMVMVHSVKVTEGQPTIASGGKVVVIKQWKPLSAELTALQYKWRVPNNSVGARSLTGSAASSTHRRKSNFSIS